MDNNLLFALFSTGKTFVAPWTENLPRITGVFPINVKPANGNKTAPSTLWQWSEVLQHPGLVFCATHTAGIPIVLMVKPDNISVSNFLRTPDGGAVVKSGYNFFYF